MAIEISIDTKKLNEAFDVFPKQLNRNMRQTFTEIGNKFVARLVKEKLSGRSSKSLGRVTGTLARSFRKTIQGTLPNGITCIVYTDAKYAATHEFGVPSAVWDGKPKHSKFLAIPIGKAKTKAGAARYSSPRSVANLSILGKTKTGGWLLGIKTKKVSKANGTSGVPLFVLVKSVRIPARLGMRKLWTDNKPKAVRLINDSINKTITQSTGVKVV